MEVIAFAHGLINLPQIKYFSLKVLQNPNVSKECLEKFATAISRLENLSQFDLYFRRLGLRKDEILELEKRIETLPNIQCSCSKESIHIYKRNN